MGMIDVIKKAGLGAVEAGNPVAVIFGTVTKASPLEVNVDQRFTLTEDFLIIPESLTHFEVDLQHTHQYDDETGSGSSTKTTQPAEPDTPQNVAIRKGLEVGDKVILLRAQGGQRFVVLDRVVST